ncbi:unnamed protein product [Angiostrongylus costaricensis]|uniref:Uncharacterized protein n=1 Tax=Angiostrongylus costaricensis TaxID=334426 RepID=A0A0R3PXR9_ANGCS|nr:unnamed protein product [Angiostrongylus costaricensis]
MAQKISVNKGLRFGMAQLGAFAKMGMMIDLCGPQHNHQFSEICWLSYCGSLESRGHTDRSLLQVFTTTGSRSPCGSEGSLPPCD